MYHFPLILPCRQEGPWKFSQHRPWRKPKYPSHSPLHARGGEALHNSLLARLGTRKQNRDRIQPLLFVGNHSSSSGGVCAVCTNADYKKQQEDKTHAFSVFAALLIPCNGVVVVISHTSVDRFPKHKPLQSVGPLHGTTGENIEANYKKSAQLVMARSGEAR